MEKEVFLGLMADLEQQQNDFMLALAKERAALAQERAELATIARQLANNTHTPKHDSIVISPEIMQEIKNVRLELIKLRNEPSNDDRPWYFYVTVALMVVVFFGSIEYGIYNLPKQTAEQFYQMYAQQPKPTKSHEKSK